MPARLRPRFEFVTPRAPEDALDRLRTVLARPDAPCPGAVFRGHAVLHVPATEQRIWSPFLSLDVEWHPDGSLIRGRYGPKPSVWSLFVAGYAICLFLALFALVFAASQWTLDQPLWALWVLPASLVGSVLIYAFARYGQHRGRDQMEALRRVLDDAVAMP